MTTQRPSQSLETNRTKTSNAWKISATVLLAALPAFTASPFKDAVAVWNFAGKDSTLTARGNVQLGVALAGDERKASLARGGDGKVAQFNGGYLEIGGPAFDPPGAEFTLLLRVRDSQGGWNAPLFGSYGGDGAASLYLRGVDGATLPFEDYNYVGGKMSTPAKWMFGWPDGSRAIHGARGVVEFLWGAKSLPAPLEKFNMIPRLKPDPMAAPLYADVKNAVLRVMFPLQPLGAKDWHDVIVRGTGAKLQLWIDGVLLDEEFPRGTTRPATAPRFFGAAQLADGKLLSGFHGQMDHAALWHRALGEKEIFALSGGEKLSRQRELAVLGAPPERMQYYRPSGHNLKPGDCIPWFHDGTFHLFYLNLRRNMHSKWDGGHGGLEIEHASSRDLVTWQHHPAVAPITEQWEAWNGTGAAAFHDGKYWMFYPTPDYFGTNGGIQLVTSPDGINWTKQSPHPFLQGGDCEIFPDPDPSKKVFHMIKMGKVFGKTLPPLNDKTLVAWVSPADLDQRGAGVLTVEDPQGHFDSLVFGEAAPRRWMAGSDNFRRTQRDQQKYAEETAKPGEWVQVAVTYAGKTVTLYRNGVSYAQYEIAEPLQFGAGARLLIGLRHANMRDEPKAHFRGAIADARVYDSALTAGQIAALRPHEEVAGPKPVVWFDFKADNTNDRAGLLASGELEGGATVRDGQLVLDGENAFLSGGAQKATLVQMISEYLKNWQELPEPFLVADASMHAATCPNWFKWNDWYYFLGGGGYIWTSRQPYGPWKRQEHDHIDSLAVPKTGAFTGNRRVYAGWMADGGFGGNLVLRDLVQFDDGTLGSKFVPEMIPPTGKPIALQESERSAQIEAKSGRQQILIANVPNNARITLTLEPRGNVKAYGLCLHTTDGATDGADFRLEVPTARAVFTKCTTSGGPQPWGGPSIGGVRGLDQPVRLDVICRHDVVDVEVDGRHTLANYYWNPKGDKLGIWVEDGTLLVRDVTIRPLLEQFSPGAIRQPEIK